MNSLFKAIGLASFSNAIQLTATNQLDAEVEAFAVPASAFDLSNWKLQVPYSSTGSFSSGYATEITQPTLATFSYDNLFYLKTMTDGTSAIVLHTPVQGVTTSGSVHPRVELREMTSSGTVSAAWGTNDGKTHTMNLTQTVTHLTSISALSTIFQVFDNTNGPFVETFFSATKGLYFYVFAQDGNSHITYYIDKTATVGTKYTLQVVISGGYLKIYYNGVLNQNISITNTATDRTAVYFKAGDYCQTYTTTDSLTDYCEVYIHSLSVTHV